MMKRKFIAPLIALLLCVSMIGVGFAGWVIATTTSDDANGTFKVYSVQQKFIKFDASSTSVIHFGGPHDATGNSGWLRWDSTTDNIQTNLEGEIAVTLKGKDNSTIQNLSVYAGQTLSFVVTFSIVETQSSTNATTYTDAKTNGYINGPANNASVTYQTTITNDGKFGEFTVTAPGTSIDESVQNFVGFGNIVKPTEGVTFTIPITFGWGSAFNYQHPIDYFNDFGAESTISNTDSTKYADKANTLLSNLNNSGINNVQYKITVVGSVIS